MSKQFQRLKVKDIIRETEQTISIVFDIPNELKKAFSYQAGQYLTLKAEINGEEVRRSYSLSSSPSEEEWKVSSKRIPDGKMSTFLDKDLEVGMELDVMPPEGRFTTENLSNPINIVLFAAGSGITPIISILKDTIQKDIHNKVHLFYGNSTEKDIIFKKELQKLSEKYKKQLNIKFFLSKESPNVRIDEINTQTLIESLPNYKEYNYFICGPEGMIEACKTGLEKMSIPKEKIHIEYFASPKSSEEKVQEIITGEVCDIKVILDGEEHEITMQGDETILESAERIGIDPPFSCHSGVCTTCQAKVLRGNVEMENNFGLADEEVEQGIVLTCISKPTTPGVIVSWDEV